MKKLLVSLMVGLMSMSTVLAAADKSAQAACHAAAVLRSQGKHVEAQAAFEKVIKDYPKASVSALANAQHGRIGAMISRSGKNAATCKELVRVLQADEPCGKASMESVKRALIKRAISAAKRELRARGKSFVTGADGVNPAEKLVQPVVDALNAPACKGINKAFSNIGISIDPFDCTALVETINTWKAQMLEDKVTIKGNWIGKTILVLGIDGYNKFVDIYNNGTGDIK